MADDWRSGEGRGGGRVRLSPALGSCRRFVRDAAGVFGVAPLGLKRAEEAVNDS